MAGGEQALPDAAIQLRPVDLLKADNVPLSQPIEDDEPLPSALVGLGADKPADVPSAETEAASHRPSTIIEIGNLRFPKKLLPAAARRGEPAVESQKQANGGGNPSDQPSRTEFASQQGPPGSPLTRACVGERARKRRAA